MLNLKPLAIILVLFGFIISGCGERRQVWTDTTNQGYRVYIPSDFYQNGLYISGTVLIDQEEIRTQLLSWVDARIEEWVRSHADLDPVNLRSVAGEQVYVLFDHWGIVNSNSPTSVCYGSYRRDTKTVKVAVYSLQATASPPFESLCPPQLILSKEETADWAGNTYWLNTPYNYFWGLIPGIGMPALVHELDHAIRAIGDNESIVHTDEKIGE